MEVSINNMEKGDFGDTSLSISNLNNTGKPTLRTKVEILQNLTQSQSIKIEKLHEDVASTLQLLSVAADEMKEQDTTDHALRTKVEVLEDVLNDHQVALNIFIFFI